MTAFVSVLLGCSGENQESGVRRASGERVRGTPGGCWKEPRIVSGGVGAIRVGAAISNLPRSCSVHDSTLAGSLTERGHVVRYRDQEILAVVAANTTGRILRVIVTDPAFRTAGDVGVGTSVATLRTVHAPLCALAGTEGRVTLFSEKLPGVEFNTSLAAPADPIRRRAMEEDVRLVPEDARIARITVTEAESPCTGPTVAFETSAALTVSGQAGRVIAESLWSQALGLRKEVVVYLPPSYDTDRTRRYPVITMLHGLWGDQWQWVRSGRIATTMDSLIAVGMPEMILVMPDGDDGWWTTWHRLVDLRGCRAEPLRRRFTPASDPSSQESPEAYCVPWAKYDDFVARDLVAKVDSMYRTHAGRAQRGIAGLSMGGYGAVSIALAYPEVFAAAASHSGLLSPMLVASPGRYAATPEELRAAAGNLWWSMEVPFGDVLGFRARDPAMIAERLVRRGNARRPALFLDVGLDDFLLDQNRAFHQRLGDLGYRHEYAEWPGGHDHAYWRAHVRESLRWMAAQFASTGSR